MNEIAVAIIQQNCSSNISENQEKIRTSIKEAHTAGAELVVLQELHNTRYFCQTEDTKIFDLAETIPGQSTDFFGRIAKELGIVIVTSLFEKRSAGLYHNTAVVLDNDGSIAGKYRKMHIPDDPGYYEKFYFTPGDLGFTPIDCSLGRLGVLVCWDQWYPEAARLMAIAGAEILIYPTAIGWDPSDSTDEQQRQLEAWITVQRGHAVANGLPIVAVNRTGFEPSDDSSVNGQVFWGNSFAAGPQGEILVRCDSDREQTAIVKISIDRSEQVRRIWPFLRDRRVDAYSKITSIFID